MQIVLRQVEQVAPTKATVLITGETGVGKDVIAEAIHEEALVKINPSKQSIAVRFIKISYRANVFGHEKGGFYRGDNPTAWCV